MIREALQFLFKLTLSRNQMLRDITLMRSEIADLKKDLVPFNDEEMEILSLRQTNTSKKRGFQKILKGIFSTIFYEPLIAYAIKTYSADQRLILISTSDLEFIYLDKDNKKELLVVELKKGRASDAVVGQIQRYMGYVKDELAEPGQMVRGVIIAFEDDTRVRRALSVAQNIEFYTYSIQFKLDKVNL